MCDAEMWRTIEVSFALQRSAQPSLRLLRQLPHPAAARARSLLPWKSPLTHPPPLSPLTPPLSPLPSFSLSSENQLAYNRLSTPQSPSVSTNTLMPSLPVYNFTPHGLNECIFSAMDLAGNSNGKLTRSDFMICMSALSPSSSSFASRSKPSASLRSQRMENRYKVLYYVYEGGSGGGVNLERVKKFVRAIYGREGEEDEGIYYEFDR